MGSNYVDLSGVYRRIEDIRSEVRDAVRQISHEVNTLHQESMREIEYLQNQLVEMERSARLRDALQRALTEIIRVRQELEDKFGSHKLVREYMLGILQANDLGLITKTTISKCTEELMISAPGYWLAPALIALAGWISDNKTLANRALKVAIDRDEEKTCLLFALITRRVNAGRIQGGKQGSDVSFQWLNRYFALQDPTNMKASVVAYLDAYSNGIFGQDVDHICSDHINNWMKVLMRKNPDFEQEQKQYWLNIFNNYCQNLDGERYLALQKISPQFPQMNAYLSKINAAEREDGVRNDIRNIINQQVNKKELIDSIDRHLENLVKQYDEKEAPLRDEEQYLSFVKELKGDEEEAQRRMDAIRAGRVDENVSFTQRLSEAITNKNAPASARKTAVYLLQNYINSAFEEFVSADKESYPDEIDLVIKDNCNLPYATPFKWEGKTVNSENREELVNTLSKQYDDAKQGALNKISDEQALKDKKKGTIIAAATFWTLIGLVVGLYIRHKGVKKLRENEDCRKSLNKYYDSNKKANIKLLNDALDGRADANQVVLDFDEKKDAQGAVVSL